MHVKPFLRAASYRYGPGMAALHKQMFDNGIAMRKRIDATLTPKQRDELRRSGPNW